MTELAVIMSIYLNDRLPFVRESIESILSQSYSDFHFYLTFDGPVKAEVEQYVLSLRDPRLRFYRIDKNGGLASALNYLLEIVLKNSDYKMIGRMDADDVSFPNRFEKQLTFLKANPEISCVGCWYHEIDERGKLLKDRRLPLTHEELRKLYIKRSPFAHPAVMYRRRLIEEAGFYPTNTILMEDNVLWGNSLKQGLKFANIPEFLLNFRIDEKFYERRSGIRYGWNFIKTRFRVNRSLHHPLYSYVFSLLIGLVKMMPPFTLRYIYVAAGRY
jgi:glycosyltransferase involved in cell wall biosynthesis